MCFRFKPLLILIPPWIHASLEDRQVLRLGQIQGVPSCGEKHVMEQGAGGPNEGPP